MFKTIYDKNDGLWKTIKIDDEGRIRTFKKAKTQKEVKDYNKKRLKNQTVEVLKKSNVSFQNVDETIRAQNKIDLALEWGNIDDLLDVENLAIQYNYRKKEIADILKKKRKKPPSQPKEIKTSYFYTPQSNSIMAFTNRGYKKILMVVNTLKDYKRIKFTFKDEDGNKFQNIFDRKDLLEQFDNPFFFGTYFANMLEELGTEKGDEGKIIIQGVL